MYCLINHIDFGALSIPDFDFSARAFCVPAKKPIPVIPANAGIHFGMDPRYRGGDKALLTAMELRTKPECY